jgi:hypothetical protein
LLNGAPRAWALSINSNLASAYRDIQLELRALVNEPTRKIPAIAEKIKKLEARSDAIRRQLQVPCPTKYGNKEAANDCVRLMQFTSLRDNETALTEAQKAEEAHLRARFDVFSASPEAVARRRREALQDAERRFKKSRLTGEFYAAPLSRKDRNELKLLRWLYPEPKRDLSQLDGDGFEMYRDHPFADELPAPDGNFYPRHSKLRPAAPKEDAEKAHLAANPELLGEATIRELEERRAVGFQLTASEEEELRDLRERYPEYAAGLDLMDLQYLYHWRREFEIARKAGLDIDAIYEQTEVCCLRLRDPSKFIHEWQARRYLRDRRGKAAGAARRGP